MTTNQQNKMLIGFTAFVLATLIALFATAIYRRNVDNNSHEDVQSVPIKSYIFQIPEMDDYYSLRYDMRTLFDLDRKETSVYLWLFYLLGHEDYTPMKDYEYESYYYDWNGDQIVGNKFFEGKKLLPFAKTKNKYIVQRYNRLAIGEFKDRSFKEEFSLEFCKGLDKIDDLITMKLVSDIFSDNPIFSVTCSNLVFFYDAFEVFDILKKQLNKQPKLLTYYDMYAPKKHDSESFSLLINDTNYVLVKGNTGYRVVHFGVNRGGPFITDTIHCGILVWDQREKLIIDVIKTLQCGDYHVLPQEAYLLTPCPLYPLVEGILIAAYPIFNETSYEPFAPLPRKATFIPIKDIKKILNEQGIPFQREYCYLKDELFNRFKIKTDKFTKDNLDYPITNIISLAQDKVAFVVNMTNLFVYNLSDGTLYFYNIRPKEGTFTEKLLKENKGFERECNLYKASTNKILLSCIVKHQYVVNTRRIFPDNSGSFFMEFDYGSKPIPKFPVYIEGTESREQNLDYPFKSPKDLVVEIIEADLNKLNGQKVGVYSEDYLPTLKQKYKEFVKEESEKIRKILKEKGVLEEEEASP
ncbi:hypothetical protein D6810_02010 [Candidatus Dojkabacteria bacterium]|uniref:Uncharacterized protein n=1 Tax=Candidatus Dojkabacteria bacterium TaxID=2099670 RepID=A0A3M0YYK6_9BACT|nr:MAG: hypothetical protein D6810_02010 [Candidatus Dojkabacteria bacterium]